jgi:hypothetical protein
LLKANIFLVLIFGFVCFCVNSWIIWHGLFGVEALSYN